MPTRTQRLLWTALPNGWSEDGRRLRLSVMLSPRLVVSPGPNDVLAAFPDVLALPALVRDARFELDLAGNVVTADRVSEPDNAVYAKLFTARTSVLSREVEDRRGTDVVSFPVAQVGKDLAGIYGELASEADGELPLLDAMRRRFAELGEQVLRQRPLDLLDGLRQRRDQAERDLDAVWLRLNLVDLYNTPLSAPRRDRYQKTGPDDPREDIEWETNALVPLPPPESFRRTIDVHAIVTALAQFPLLLRLTGLVVDVEVPRDAFPVPLTGPLAVRATWTSLPETAAAGVTLLPDLCPFTQTQLNEGVFAPVSLTPAVPPQVEGFARLAPGQVAVSQVDLNGSALKLRQFAITMAQHPGTSDAPPPKDPVAVQPDRTGTPSLRSGGLTVAMRRRAHQLKDQLDRSGAMDDADGAGTPVLLHTEDLMRGYRAEVLDHAAPEWRALGRRDTRYTFCADSTGLDDEDNEGIVRLAASKAADGSHPNVLKLYEGLFTWSGWSLAAPPIGRALTPENTVGDSTGVAPVGLPLDVDHRVRSRSLPVLRFGHRYSFRLRVVDLAGNALGFDPRRGSPGDADTEPFEYLRFEPVPAPTLALVSDAPGGGGLPGPGEDLATVAIRSLNATPEDNAVATSDVQSRHIVPPMTTQRQAEQHGVLDVDGRLDPRTYTMLVARDAALPEVVHPMTGKAFPAAPTGFSLPFLPDPMAQVLMMRVYGRTGVGSVEQVRLPWYRGGAAWPDARPFVIEVLEQMDGAAPAPISVDEAAGVVRLPLAKADRARVRVGHQLDAAQLALLGIWRWAEPHLAGDPGRAARVRDLAQGGEHWMLTPWYDAEIVHAVQKPLVTPAIEGLGVARSTGQTSASVLFSTPIDTRSTEKLNLVGRWLEPVDDPAESGPRARVGGGDRAAELPFERLDAPGVDPPGTAVWGHRNPVTHEFGDTRYRRIGYRLTATTRFTSFMPAPLRDPAAAADLTVTSEEAIGFVPNTAPPPPPDVIYVVPTFGGTRSGPGEDGEQRSKRGGGGLRIYLRRKWLVSGYLEMLGIVLPRAGEASAAPGMSTKVTQWGADPTWNSASVLPAAPALERFSLAVTSGPIPQERLDHTIPQREGDIPEGPLRVRELPLPGEPGTPAVDVAPHLVHYDDERQLWYADVVVDPGPAYAPFIRLALARYQPISAPGSHLSPAVTAEVVQLLPDRVAVLRREDPTSVSVAVYGHAPRQPRSRPPSVEFGVQQMGAGSTELDWEELPGVSVQGLAVPGPVADLPLLRAVVVRLPRERAEGERWRLVVTEVEVRAVDPEHLDPEPVEERDPRRRVVYLETVEL